MFKFHSISIHLGFEDIHGAKGETKKPCMSNRHCLYIYFSSTMMYALVIIPPITITIFKIEASFLTKRIQKLTRIYDFWRIFFTNATMLELFSFGVQSVACALWSVPAQAGSLFILSHWLLPSANIHAKHENTSIQSAKDKHWRIYLHKRVKIRNHKHMKNVALIEMYSRVQFTNRTCGLRLLFFAYSFVHLFFARPA